MRAPATHFRWLALLALWAALGALQPAHAGPARADGPSRCRRRRRASGWRASTAAAHERNYQGTLVFSADGALSSARVAHFCDGAQSYERVEVLDGRMQQIYRHNDRVLTLWPQSRVAVVEERDPRQASLRPVIEPRAEEHYEVREQGTEHVAGREAQVLLLSPRDANRFAQRLWVDSRSGLMLRADVLGAAPAGAGIQRLLAGRDRRQGAAADGAAADEAARRLPPGAAAAAAHQAGQRGLDAQLAGARLPAQQLHAPPARPGGWRRVAGDRCCRRCSPTA